MWNWLKTEEAKLLSEAKKWVARDIRCTEQEMVGLQAKVQVLAGEADAEVQKEVLHLRSEIAKMDAELRYLRSKM
jgi:hypothetical protein